jgi:hypothetical protein
MTNQSSPNHARPRWSKRLKTALAGLALAGVLFSGAAVAGPAPSDSDETARGLVSVYVKIDTPVYSRALTWS